MRGWRVLLFDTDGIQGLLSKVRWPVALGTLLLCVALQAMPTSGAELVSVHRMFAFLVVKYVVMLGLLLLLLDRMGGTQSVLGFVTATSLASVYALSVLLALAYVSLFVFDRLFGIPVVSGAVRAFAPYYSVVVFGWVAESVSGIPSVWRRAVFGMAAITLLMVYILYSNIPLCALGVVSRFGLEHLLCA